ncbi:ABC transporter substrate-binding protein [Agromyces sp. NPDC056523]|uniref:ABC transporter substrate-binding protein n=1 Tax=Agromyces sp. NPDC056523 TaxID=3345850 RepID=UPI0036708273
MRITRTITAAVAVGTVLFAVSGCSASSDSEDAAAADSITIWHNAADNDGIKALYDGFTEATGIEVELEPIPADGFESTVTTKWATGDRPDILEYHPTSSALALLNAGENMQDLSDMDFVDASGTLYDNAGSLNGKVYAAITGFPSIFGLYYNKTVFDEAGLEVPQTFDDLLAVCPDLQAAGVDAFHESGGSQWPTQITPFLYGADANVGNELGTALAHNEVAVNDPDGVVVKGLETYLEVRDACFQDNYATGTFENAVTEVYSGNAAMTVIHSDTYDIWQDAAGGDEELLSETVGFTGLSTETARAAFGPGPLGSYMAPKTGDAGKEAAALKFIEYATGEGYGPLIEANKAFPVIDGYDVPEGISGLKQEFKDAYDSGATIGYPTDVTGFGDNFAADISRMLAGEITAQELADATQANVERASKAAGIEGW